jgi:hypothetical protein
VDQNRTSLVIGAPKLHRFYQRAHRLLQCRDHCQISFYRCRRFKIFYLEAGAFGAPVLLLLYGFQAHFKRAPVNYDLREGDGI